MNLLFNKWPLLDADYTASRRGQKLNLKNSPPKFGPLGPLDPLAKGFRSLGLHLLFPLDYDLRPVDKVHHLSPPQPSSLMPGI